MKTELSKRDLSLSRKKDDLVKRLMKTLNEENSKLDKPEKYIENVLTDMIKELLTKIFKAQEETIRKFVFSCNTDTIAQLDRLTEEI